MNDLEKLLVCAVASIMVHAVLAVVLEQLPERHDVPAPRKVTITVQERRPPLPEPPKEHPKPPEPPKPPPPIKAPIHEAPHPHVVRPQIQAEQPHEAPPPVNAPVAAPSTDEPVFGTTMESTSTAGTGPAVPIGNTPNPAAPQGSAAPVKPATPPIAAFEATKMPIPQGNCSGKYTDEALKAAVEGTVVLDLIVGADGRVRDVKVIQGLPHGLTEAALAAARACHFSPGEKDGAPVPVRVRGFKVTFVLPEQ